MYIQRPTKLYRYHEIQSLLHGQDPLGHACCKPTTAVGIFITQESWFNNRKPSLQTDSEAWEGGKEAPITTPIHNSSVLLAE